MDIKNIIYILEAYKCQSINKAAQNVFISQSHLSSIIKNTEQEIGYPIFHRTPSGLTITTEGRHFIDSAEKIVKNYESILDVPQRLLNCDALTICCTPSSSVFQYYLEYIALHPSQCSDTFLESGLRTAIHKVVVQSCRIGILMMIEKQIAKYQQIANDYKLSFTILRSGIPMRIFMAKDHPLAGLPAISTTDTEPYPMITDINVDKDDRFRCTNAARRALYVSDRGTSYDAVCHGNYLLAGMMSPVNLHRMGCISKPLKDGEPMALCLIQAQHCNLNLREQQFIHYLKQHLEEL